MLPFARPSRLLSRPRAGCERLVAWLSSRWVEAMALLLARVALAGIFWRAGRTKVEEGTLLTISDTARFLFETEYSAVPLPPDLAVFLATGSEHLFPVLLAVGLLTRLSALALLGMTLTIQVFVYPDAWWSTHILWAALCLILIVRGGGALSLDARLAARRPG